MRQIFACSKCGSQSQRIEEIELCEAQHMGLKTLEEKREYDSLLTHVRSCSHIVSHTCNEATRKKLEDAIKKILQYEKEHNLTVP